MAPIHKEGPELLKNSPYSLDLALSDSEALQKIKGTPAWEDINAG